MINLEEFALFVENNFELITGVPCSYFKDFLTYLEIHKNKMGVLHIHTSREDEAIGIASGAAFSKKIALIYMQNSGLGNIGDALTSLAQLYKLPMLILVSLRGLDEDKDFPEHSLMGQINNDLLDAFQLPYMELDETNWKEIMETTVVSIKEKSLPAVLLIKRGVLSS